MEILMDHIKISVILLCAGLTDGVVKAGLEEQSYPLMEIISPEQGIQPAAYNAGANLAGGDWIAFLQQDTRLAATCMETLLWAVAASPHTAGVYANYIDKRTGKTIVYPEEIEGLLQSPPPVFFVKKETWLQNGGLDENLPLEQGLADFWRRLLGKGEKVLHISAPLFEVPLEKEVVFAKQQGAPHTLGEKAYCHAKAQQEKPFAGLWQGPKTWPLSPAKQGKNLLLVLPHMVMGGADQFNLDLMDGLLEKGWKITVITTLPEHNTWRQLFLKRTVDLFELPAFLDMGAWPAFIEHIITSRSISHLLFTNSYFGYYLAPILRLRFPQLVLADYIHMEEWYYRGGGYAKPSGAVGEFLDKTFVCNENTRRVMLEVFKRRAETVQTVYIGVNTSFYNPNKIPEGLLREELNLQPERPVVLFPCRITPQKRPLLMLQIAELVKQQVPDVAFVVAGDGVLLDEMQRETKNKQLEQTVYFAGSKEDLRFFYKDATITLVCSLKEGLSLTSYESLAMGTPVITSDVGGQAELIDDSVGAVLPLLEKEDGSDGALKHEINKEEAVLFAKEIINLLTDKEKYNACKNNARKKVLNGFTTENMQQEMANQLSFLQKAEFVEKRELTAKENQHLQQLFENYLEIYMAAEAFEREKQIVERERDYYQAYYVQEGHPSAVELNRIRHLKSYRVIQSLQENKIRRALQSLIPKKQEVRGESK